MGESVFTIFFVISVVMYSISTMRGNEGNSLEATTPTVFSFTYEYFRKAEFMMHLVLNSILRCVEGNVIVNLVQRTICLIVESDGYCLT